MLTHGSILVSFLWLVEQIPTPPPPVKRQRGRQEFYSDKLFVKALIVIIIRRLWGSRSTDRKMYGKAPGWSFSVARGLMLSPLRGGGRARWVLQCGPEGGAG
jgi:hypothetical protein